jgi:hypothetical protein
MRLNLYRRLGRIERSAQMIQSAMRVENNYDIYAKNDKLFSQITSIDDRLQNILKELGLLTVTEQPVDIYQRPQEDINEYEY